MSYSAENIRKGILLFLRNFVVSNCFMIKRGLSRFSVEIFLLTVPKSSLWSSLRLFRKFGVSKSLCIKGGITIFRLESFV